MTWRWNGGADPDHGVSWDQARHVAATSWQPLEPRRVALTEAVGAVLAESLLALTDLPAGDVAAMDGWAVSGPGPWRVTGQISVGQRGAPLADGTAVAVNTGSALPVGADAVLRNERGGVDSAGHLTPRGRAPEIGTDIRARGQECVVGDELLPAGTRLSVAAVGLAAAAGHDDLVIIRPPDVSVLILGDELLERGPARDGRVRDALGPMLPAWIAAAGGRAFPLQRLGDDVESLRAAVEDSAGDVVITTGATARSTVDHLHEALLRLGASLVVDGVAVRPGHPMVLAALADGRPFVGLPGNPLAAVAALHTLVAPLLTALRGGVEVASWGVLADDVPAHPSDTRLVPVARANHATNPVLAAAAHPVTVSALRHVGPAMLRGLVDADDLAVIPPGGGAAGSPVQLLPVLRH